MKNMKIDSSPPGGRFAEGGNTKMFGWRGTGTQEPGQTSQAGTGSKSGIAPHTGPSGVASSASGNRDYAGTQQAGTSGPTKSGGNAKFAEGGKTSMFGNRGSQRARGGCSAPD